MAGRRDRDTGRIEGAMEEHQGTVRIAPQVLATIARLTIVSVPGVAQLHHDLSSDVDRLFKGKGGGGGVSIELVDDAVVVDLSIVAKRDVNLYELGREIQAQVSRAIKETVGMPVLAVNVHIADVSPAADE
jgi:uncharacterized alkaline shock family protein YloU